MLANELYLRIATSEAGLANGNFVVWQLPEPDNIAFSDHTQTRPQGGGGLGRHGYNTVEMLWNRLFAIHAYTLRTLIETAETTGGQGNGTLWATVPKTTGESPGPSWIDISGIVIMPEWEPTPRLVGYAYDNVVLRFTDVTVENEPSTVGY